MDDEDCGEFTYEHSTRFGARSMRERLCEMNDTPGSVDRRCCGKSHPIRMKYSWRSARREDRIYSERRVRSSVST